MAITRITKTYNEKNSKPQQRHRIGTVSKILLEGLNRFYVATTLVLSSAVVYTRHLFSPREGFLTHQCNVSENIKSEYRDETTMRTLQQDITEMLNQKKTVSRTPMDPTRAKASGTKRLTSQLVFFTNL